MRIDIHLDEEHAAKFRYLLKATPGNTDDVVEHAIDLYYDEIKRREGRGARRLLESDFIGGAEGEENLSTNYKL